MSAAALAVAPPRASLLGRPFVSPLFDLLIIGGGLSIIVVGALRLAGAGGASTSLVGAIPFLVFASTYAHVAASTVRLYTRPGAFRDFPFLTMVFPLATIAVLTIGIWRPDDIGRHLQALYLTWSPYHYARQAYGLSVMYCYRSECALTVGEKRLLLLTALAPFVYAFFNSSGSGLEWFVAPATLLAHSDVFPVRSVVLLLGFATFALPLVMLGWLTSRGKRLPLISLMILLSNGVWWVTLVYMEAFVWATIFHGLQYLAITLVFHARERTGHAGSRRSPLLHAAAFYAWCLPLGYVLFLVWPYAYVAVGFGWAESLLLTTAAINIHHVIVDAYIWRLRKDPNYRIVTGLPDAA